MSDYGKVIAPDTVRFERLLPGPIERVWSYLTESEKRGKWLAAGEMELRVGGRVELRFHHADLSPQAEAIPERYKWCEGGVTMTGRITCCEPPRLLSHTWGEPAGGESEVTYELKPRGDDVLLVLTHRRISRPQMPSVGAGWHTHLGILADHLQGRAPQPFWSTHARLEAAYEERIAAGSAP